MEYAWTRTSGTGGTLADANTLTPRFTAPALNPGDAPVRHEFRLTVTDDVVGSTPATDTVTVTVTAFPALTANAGLDKSVVSEGVVMLDGSGTASDSVRTVEYAWTRTSGTGGTLADANTLTPRFTAPALNPGDAPVRHEFRLTVTDDVVGSTPATDTVTVTVTAFPALTANAGLDKSVVSEGVVTLDGSGTASDSVRTVEYAWTRTSGTGGTLADANTLTPRFTAPALNPGDAPVRHEFRLTVTDDVVGSTPATDTVTVTVTAFPALTANAGLDKSVVSEGVVTLDGSGTASDSVRTVEYAWTRTSGTGGTLADANTLTPRFTAPALNPGDAPVRHEFRLTVTDDVVGSTPATDTVTVTVTAFPALTANAGLDKSVVSEGVVTLDGSGTASDSVRTVEYAWTRTSGTGGTLADANTLTPRFTAPALNPGDAPVRHEFRLTVTDDVVGSTPATDTVTVTVTAFPALTANAGLDKSVVSEGVVTLDGSGTASDSVRTVEYAWTRTSGTGGTLADANTLTPRFTAPALNPGDAPVRHEFRLTVTDDVVGSTPATDTVTVTVTAFPALTANAGLDKSVVSEGVVTLDGSGTASDSVRTVEYAWTRTSGTGGTLADANTLTPRFTAPALNPGDAPVRHEFRLTVTDDVVGSTPATDTVTVTVTAFPALTANAGLDKSVVSEGVVTLDGSGTASDSVRTVEYAWTRTSGTGGTLADANTLTPRFTAPALNPGDAPVRHEFRLTVTDDVVGSTPATDTVTVTVTAFPALTANAGLDKSVVSEGVVTLDGSGTASDSVRTVEYAWTRTSGTGGTLADANTLTPRFTAPALNPGDAPVRHEFRLTVTDDVVGSTPATDTVTVTVTAFPALTANAGLDKSVVSEGVVTLDGSGTASDSVRTVEYAWTRTSGTGGTLADANTLTPRFTAPALNPGDAPVRHEFRLTVTDDVVGSTPATDTVTVTVTAFPALTANAGLDKSVVSEGVVTLDGSGTASDSVRTVEYAWTRTSGTGGTLADANTLTPRFTAPALNPGDAPVRHEFRLTVTDDVVGSTPATDTVTVTVTAFPALTANAGLDKSVVSEGVVTLDGSGTASDSVRTVEYAWTRTSGTGGTLADANTLTPRFTAPALNPGDAPVRHEFRLTVTDDVVGSTPATDTVTVTVTAFPALTANAGLDKSVVSEGVVTLDGSGTASDSVRTVEYAWTRTSGTGGTLADANTLTPRFTAPALNPGDAPVRHEFRLTVTDDVVGSTPATDTVTVTVTAFPALTANAGLDKSVVSEGVVTLDGSGTASDSVRTVEYAWTRTSGTGGTLADANTLTPRFTAPALNPGDAPVRHEFRLTVTDDVVGSTPATDTVTVTVTAFPALTANAGLDKSVVSEGVVTLDGSGTASDSVRTVEYAWTRTSGTGGTLADANTLTPRFTAPALNPGDAPVRHEFRLTVTDDVVGSTPATDTVTVTVTAFPALTANAGLDKSVVSEGVVTLDGSGTASDSVRTVEYAWTRTSGTGGTLADANTLTPRFTAPALNPGDAPVRHEFRLTVTDDVVGSTPATDTVTVTVTAFPALTANAGLDKSVVSEGVVTLDGSGTASDSVRTVEYAWTRTSGTGGTLADANTLTPRFTAPALNPGDAPVRHEFRLTVTDDVVGSTPATDTVTVTVTAFPALTANAGLDKSVVSEGVVTLDGSGTASDSVRTVEYAWTRTSGTGGTLADANTLTPRFTAPALNPGDAPVRHEFRLTVTDDVVGSTPATDTVTVTVTAFPALTANAGLDKSVVSEGVVTLDGSGTASDSVRTVEYAWTRTSGTGGTLADANTLTPRFTAPALNPGDAPVRHEFRLTVTDDVVGSTPATDTVTVTVTAFPALTANAGLDKSVVSEGVVTLDGSGTASDSVRTVEYAWTRTSGTGGTLADANTLTPRFTAPALNPGDAPVRHEFRLTVTDDVVGSTPATDTVTVTVTAFPALTANAGLDKSVVSEGVVTLDGSGTASDSVAAAVKRHSPFGDNGLVRASIRERRRGDPHRHEVGRGPTAQFILHNQSEDIYHVSGTGFQCLRRETLHGRILVLQHGRGDTGGPEYLFPVP